MVFNKGKDFRVVKVLLEGLFQLLPGDLVLHYDRLVNELQLRVN